MNNDGELAIDVVDEPAMAQLLQEEMTARGVDGHAARSREERCMLEDASHWLHEGTMDDSPHPKTGATALHVAAAKGYIKVMRSAKICFRSTILLLLEYYLVYAVYIIMPPPLV